jgi:hypothetical protein
VFSAIDAILLKPLPFPESDQLMLVQQSNPRNAQWNSLKRYPASSVRPAPFLFRESPPNSLRADAGGRRGRNRA